MAAAQEERFTRRKHDAAFPLGAIRYVLEEAGMEMENVDYVVFYDKPLLKYERLLETYIANAPRGFSSFRKAMPVWLREKLFLKDHLLKVFRTLYAGFKPTQLMFSEHHFSHAASAYYPSPFDESVVLTLDGVGEWATSSVAIGNGGDLDIVREIHFPHSLGLLYSAFTYYTGFKVNSGEYKVMGLAPYGTPRFKDVILSELVDVKEDGSFRLNQSYFSYMTGLTMTGRRFSRLFGQPVRKPDMEEISQFHMDVAASVQAVTEDVILRMTRSLAAEYGIPNLCLAGGVALNCVANGKILRDGAFKRLWIQPAAGDAGGAIGAALGFWYHELKQPRPAPSKDLMQGGYLGPEFTDEQIEQELLSAGARFERLTAEAIIERTAQLLAESQSVGWFQGRMEFGPRALGGRSILHDARDASAQKTLNLKIKYRESFRPFAPSVLREHVGEWFELKEDSPYMLLVADVKESRCTREPTLNGTPPGLGQLSRRRSEIPAVTHVDYTARIQTVHQETNPRYYALIRAFQQRTGCPVLVNTSFNVRGEPIVCSPTDAFRCFMGTGLDVLSIGSFLLKKDQQDVSLIESYKDCYAPD